MLIAPDPDTGEAIIQYRQQEDSLGDFGALESIVYQAYSHSPLRGEVSLDEVETLLEEHRARVKLPLCPL